MTGDRSALPPSMQILDGTAADPPFSHVIEAYIAHLQEGEMPFLVADSALSHTDNQQRLARVRWLTCVPERIGLARVLIEAVAAADIPPPHRKDIARWHCALPMTECAGIGRSSGRQGRAAGVRDAQDTGGSGTKVNRARLEALDVPRRYLAGDHRGGRGAAARNTGLSLGDGLLTGRGPLRSGGASDP